MRIVRFAALGVAGLLALGCADTSSNSPTDPGLDVRFAKPVAAACDAAVSKTAEAEAKAMVSGAALTQAQTNWSAVKAACSASNADAANGPLMSYLAHLRGLYPTGLLTPKKGTKEGAFLGHLNTVFAYVGYPTPDLPAGAMDVGILGVILSTGGIREYQRAHLGAFLLPEQGPNGDQRGHVFVMSADGPGCLSVDNLTQVANCAELDSYPVVSPRFDPAIQVGICVPEGLPQAGLVLGHETPTGTEVAGQLNYPAGPDGCHENKNVASDAGLFGNLANRLASLWTNTVGVRTAYATDKGLGGIGSILSPWGGLKALIFATSFNAPHVVDSPPALVEGDYTFQYSVTAPGSIVIRSALGNHTGPLVVLSQGGGACANCGGLEFRANFFSASDSAADDGVYEINWISVQASPSVKGAPFVVRDGSGHEVARLTYVTEPSGNKLYYNNTTHVGTWVRNEAQNFRITVDLNANTTTLRIGNTDVATGRPFVDPAANSIASFNAEFSGIDSGVMGLDEIGVQRMTDPPKANY